MSKHPIDHDRQRDASKVAEAYAKIERRQAGKAGDPKVKALTKASRSSENTATRLEAFVKIDRERADP